MSHCRHHLRMLPIKPNNSRFPSPCGHDLFLIRVPISHNAAVWPFSDLRHARQFSPLCNCTSHDVEVSFIGGFSTFQLQISNFMITKAICIYCECNEARSLYIRSTILFNQNLPSGLPIPHIPYKYVSMLILVPFLLP